MIQSLLFNVQKRPKSAISILKLKHRSFCLTTPCCSTSSAQPEPKPNVEPDSESDKKDAAASATESPSKNANQNIKSTSSEVESKLKNKTGLSFNFFENVKTKLADIAYSPVPSQYKHPLIKGFVVNQIDPAMMVFPEYDETAHVNDAEAYANRIERLMSELDSSDCDQKKRIPAHFIEECKKLGLFGLQIPTNYGGQGLCHKALTRCHEELSRDWSLYVALSTHNDLACWAIAKFGTDAQKAKYLPRLASGESVAAFCLHESSCGQDVAAMSTTAYRTGDPQLPLVVDGVKDWVTNSAAADILVVFAKIKTPVTPEDELIPSTAFIIDRKEVQGVSDIDRKDTVGLRGANISGLQFDGVKVDESSILGVEENGFSIAVRTMAANRYLFPAAAAACLKRCLHQITLYCNSTKRWEAMLSDSNAIKKRVAAIAKDIFALETIAYYMAGWLDDDPTKDFLLEGTAAIRFSRLALKRALDNLVEIRGADARTTHLNLEQLQRDITTLCGYMSTDDVLSGYVASEAFKLFAAEHSSVLYKAKNQMQYPWHFVKDKSDRMEMYMKEVKMKHYINEHVHPSLEECCRFIETTLARFESIFKAVVYSTGKLVEDEHIVLDRVCDILTNLFIMLTTVSRASRSYCIGLKNADSEMYLAESLCLDLKIQTTHLLTELIELDAPAFADIYVKKIGEQILTSRGYMIENPTARNW